MEKLVTLHHLKDFYQYKKVFVTGHTGFKGAWLTMLLQSVGAIVKGYALAPEYENGLFEIVAKNEIAESVIADIRNKEQLKREVLSFQPDFIFHLAAQPLVRRSYEIPSETFEVNVVGTANLLEAMKDLPQHCNAVIITTDKVYQNKEQDILYKEEDALGGYDPYSASKACTELVVSSFRNSFFNRERYKEHQKILVTARAGNVIGGGDWSKDRLIPDIVKALTKGEAIKVRNPNSVRPWQHVLEPLTGYLLLAQLVDTDPAQYGVAYNFGPLPDDHLTVKELVETAIELWGSGRWQDLSDADEPHEASLLKLDINKAIRELNWLPKLGAKESIGWTINSYKKSKSELADFARQQISEYLQL